MSRLPVQGSDNGTWGTILNDFLSVALNSNGTLKSSAISSSGGAVDSAVVHNSGNESIAGVKTFSSSPIVPTPGSGTAAANKDYVDTSSTGRVAKIGDTMTGTLSINKASDATNNLHIRAATGSTGTYMRSYDSNGHPGTIWAVDDPVNDSGTSVNMFDGHLTQTAGSHEFLGESRLELTADQLGVNSAYLAAYDYFKSGPAELILDGTTQAASINVTLTVKSLVVGTAALPTNATDGFAYLPTCAGTPTGTPVARTGTRAAVYDTTANKIWVYNGSWRSITLA